MTDKLAKICSESSLNRISSPCSLVVSCLETVWSFLVIIKVRLLQAMHLIIDKGKLMVNINICDKGQETDC
jgi:hypothetical protein